MPVFWRYCVKAEILVLKWPYLAFRYLSNCIFVKATHTVSLVSLGQTDSSYYILLNFFLRICNRDLVYKHLVSNPNLCLDISYLNTKFGVNWSRQTQITERKLNFLFRNSDIDLDCRHRGRNPKLPLDVSCKNTKFGVNRSKHTQYIERQLNF